MSTFTEWNGPQGCGGPSTSDMTKLADAYIEMKSRLERHIDESANAAGSKVHDVKALVDDTYKNLEDKITGRAEKSTVTALQNQINGDPANPGDKGIVGRITELEDNVTEQGSTLANKAGKDELEAYAKAADLSALQKQVNGDSAVAGDTGIRGQVAGLEENVTALQDSVQSLENAGTFEGKVKVKETVDYVKWCKFGAPYVAISPKDTEHGSQGGYLLGQVSADWKEMGDQFPEQATKSCRAYIKYINTAPFDAICDITATRLKDGSCTASLTVHISKQSGTWENLRFWLVSGTDSNKRDGIWLAISADNLAKSDSEYSNLSFNVCGESFIPVGAKEYYAVNGQTSEITSAAIGGNAAGITSIDNLRLEQLWSDSYMDGEGNNLISVSESTKYQDPDENNDIRNKVKPYKAVFIGSSAYDDYIFMKRPGMLIATGETDSAGKPVIEKSYFITAQDIMNMSLPVGIILRWAPVDNDGKLINIPAGFLACDGSSVSAADYPDLAKQLPPDDYGMIRLPAEDHSIIKAVFFSVTDIQAQPDYDEALSTLILNDKIEKERKRAEAAEQGIHKTVTVNREHTAFTFDTASELPATVDAGNGLIVTDGQLAFVKETMEWKRADVAEDNVAVTWSDYDMYRNVNEDTAEAIGTAVEAEKARAEAEEQKLGNAVGRTYGGTALMFATTSDLPGTAEDTNTGLVIKDGQLAFIIDMKKWKQAAVTDGTVAWSDYDMYGNERADITAEIEAKVSEEAGARAYNDGLIADRVTNEENSRGGQYNSLNDRMLKLEDVSKDLAKETQDRKDADGLLRSDINQLKSDTGTLQTDTEQLKTDVKALQTDTEQLGTRLNTAETNISTETERRVSGDEALGARVTVETEQRVSGDKELNDRITALHPGSTQDSDKNPGSTHDTYQPGEFLPDNNP